MNNTIQEIINKIPSGLIFDSHTIINMLIEKYSDVYLSSNTSGLTTELYHAAIGRIIAWFAPNLITRVGDSWSKNIHLGYGKCSVWKKN